jgi:1,4-dihydroxy-2-naphthoate polyprenyltransferase
MRTLTWLPFAAAAAIGLLACGLLVINNLRDIPTDSESGKRTLAVVLGDERTRALYIGCILVPFCLTLVLAPVRPLALLALAALPLAFAPARQVHDGATGRRLIVALGQTGRLELAYGALLTLGLAIKL